jgi:apolipoprotein N-acyltransferase
VGSLLTLLPLHWVYFGTFCIPQIRAGDGTLPFYQMPGPERMINQVSGTSGFKVSGTSGFKVSGTSGFDMDYPSLIRAAGREKVDLMIQSCWTWGAFGARHAVGDAMRAVENGFTLLRCSSDGVTAVYSPQGETIARTYTGAGPQLVVWNDLQIPRRAFTLYPFIGINSRKSVL